MFLFINSLNWIAAASIITVLSSAFYISLLILVRKHFNPEKFKKQHDVAGYSFSVIGVLYSVLLGFIVVSAQGRFDSVSNTLSEEATALADVYRDSVIFPSAERNAIRAAIVDYIHYVTHEEWKLLSAKQISPEMQRSATAIWNVIYCLTPASEKENTWYAQIINKMNDFTTARLKRQLSFNQHISPMMWVLLLSGALITICFILFFSMESFYAHMIIIAVISTYINFMLYLIYCLDHIFDGPIALRPDTLNNLLEVFKIWNQNGS
jgi:hypothetical protein